MVDRTWTQRLGLTRRQQEVGPGEYADEVYVRNAWDAAVTLGRAYIFSTGRLDATGAAVVSMVVENPAASGVVATVTQFAPFATSLGWATLRRNPAGGLPVTERTVLRVNGAAGLAPVSRLLANNDVGPLTGGDVGPQFGIPGNVRVDIGPIGIPLMPGETLGISVDFAAGADFAASVWVAEEDLT